MDFFRIGRLSLLLLVIFFLLPFHSCNKDDDGPDVKEENEALYELMNDHYYWNEELPELNPSSYPSPYELLEALRFRPMDRWSYVSTMKEFNDFLESRYIGYGFGSAWDNEGKLRVTMVFADSEMYEYGVRRGWVLEAINGAALQTSQNINQLLGENTVGVKNDFSFRKPDNTLVELSLEKREIQMNNVLHVELFERASKKIGYVVFKAFTNPGLDELKIALAYFANEGIQELVLDLRYNSGGQNNVANYLASMIGGQKVAGETFSKYEFNNSLTSENFDLEFMEVDVRLDIERLIVISTRQTASASEIVISGLKPYMPVVVVGDRTYGKPMGMRVWNYGDEYAYAPITFKIQNADGEGDYFEGIEADLLANDDVLRDFGDPEEASLKQALAFIEHGIVTKVLPEKRPPYIQPWEQMTGLRAYIGAH